MEIKKILKWKVVSQATTVKIIHVIVFPRKCVKIEQ